MERRASATVTTLQKAACTRKSAQKADALLAADSNVQLKYAMRASSLLDRLKALQCGADIVAVNSNKKHIDASDSSPSVYMLPDVTIMCLSD